MRSISHGVCFGFLCFAPQKNGGGLLFLGKLFKTKFVLFFGEISRDWGESLEFKNFPWWGGGMNLLKWYFPNCYRVPKSGPIPLFRGGGQLTPGKFIFAESFLRFFFLVGGVIYCIDLIGVE